MINYMQSYIPLIYNIALNTKNGNKRMMYSPALCALGLWCGRLDICMDWMPFVEMTLWQYDRLAVPCSLLCFGKPQPYLIWRIHTNNEASIRLDDICAIFLSQSQNLANLSANLINNIRSATIYLKPLIRKIIGEDYICSDRYLGQHWRR